ncbi:MAG: hypothetical protein ACLFTB_09310 [Desulfovibrionales bacterium]
MNRESRKHSKQDWLLWTGGMVALAALGGVKLMGKTWGVTGLLAGMIVLAVLALVFLFKVVIPILERRD